MTDEARNLSARWKVLESIGHEITTLAKMAHEDSSTYQLIDISAYMGDAVNRAGTILDQFKRNGFDIKV